MLTRTPPPAPQGRRCWRSWRSMRPPAPGPPPGGGPELWGSVDIPRPTRAGDSAPSSPLHIPKGPEAGSMRGPSCTAQRRCTRSTTRGPASDPPPIQHFEQPPPSFVLGSERRSPSPPPPVGAGAAALLHGAVPGALPGAGPGGRPPQPPHPPHGGLPRRLLLPRPEGPCAPPTLPSPFPSLPPSPN